MHSIHGLDTLINSGINYKDVHAYKMKFQADSILVQTL